MSTAVRGGGRLRIASEARREPIVPSSVLGMALFVFTELMLFAGLMSGFAIIRASALVWPPPDQPRLPLEATAVTTLALLTSGVLLFVARRRFRKSRAAALNPLLLSVAFGAFFVVFQGFEWVALIGQGLTLTSSTLGWFFFLIVGMHALHAVVALGMLANAWVRLRRGWLASSQLATVEVFWYFVVGVWPALYATVYL